MRGTLVHEADHMTQRRVITQLQLVVTLDPIRLTHRREQLRLLHRVHTQIRLQIQIQRQHLCWVPRLLRNQPQDRRRHLIPNRGRNDRLGNRRRRSNRHDRRRRNSHFGDSRGHHRVRGTLVHEADHMTQRRVITQLQLVVTLDPIRLTHRREQLRLLHRVHTQIRLQIQIQRQHLCWVARLLRNQPQDRRRHLIHSRGRNDRLGNGGRRDNRGNSDDRRRHRSSDRGSGRLYNRRLGHRCRGHQRGRAVVDDAQATLHDLHLRRLLTRDATQPGRPAGLIGDAVRIAQLVGGPTAAVGEWGPAQQHHADL